VPLWSWASAIIWVGVDPDRNVARISIVEGLKPTRSARPEGLQPEAQGAQNGMGFWKGQLASSLLGSIGERCELPQRDMGRSVKVEWLLLLDYYEICLGLTISLGG